MPILTETFEGSPEGMNVSLPAQELPDTQARYMQDILIDYPGLIRRRGPLRKVAGTSPNADKVSGIIQTLDPAGANRVALLAGTASTGYFAFLNDAYAPGATLEISKDSDIDLPATPPGTPYRIIDAKQARGGGILVGVSDTYNTTVNQALALWRGARKADYGTGTITAAVNTKTITGVGTSFTTNVEPGMFLFIDGTPRSYLGTVKSVDSGTQLTLENPSLRSVAGVAFSLQSRRGLAARVMKGRITCATTAATVTGANTKFKDQNVKNPSGDTWRLYRMSDGFYIGDVTSVQSNIALTLTANAALALSNERYFAVNDSQHYGVKLNGVSTNSAFAKVGFLNAVYAERQFYANLGRDLENTNRVWFSDPLDLEGLDLSPSDGDFIPVGTARGSSSPIRALSAAYNALVILKEDEVYALRGSSPSTFSVTKLHDDGVLGGMSVQSYGGGVLWAGRNGINYYNGVEVENLTQERLGDYYKNLIRSFNPSTHRMWSMVVRDHYMLFIENMEPPISIIKGLKSSAPSQMVVSIYMPTKGITFLRNLNIRGAVSLPADTGESPWFVVNGYPTTLVEAGNTAAPTGYLGTNLQQNAQGFEAGIGNWGPYTNPDPVEPVVSIDPTTFYSGARSLKVDINKPGGAASSRQGAWPLGFPTVVTSGVTYTLSARVKVSSGTRSIRCYRSGPDVDTADSFDVGTDWMLVSHTFTPGSTGNTTPLIFDNFNMPTGESFWIDDVQIEIGSTPTEFVSGPAMPIRKDRMIATKITTSTDRAEGRISIYADGLGASALGECKVRLALYADSAGAPGALMSQSELNVIPAGSAAGWVDFDFADWKASTTGTYWLAIMAEKDNHVRVWTKSHAGFSVAAATSQDFDLGFTDPFGTLHATNNRNADYALKISGANRSTIQGYICDSGDLFDVEDRDELGCDSGVPGPDFYYESKKFAAGDSLRKKLFKQLAMHYIAQNGPIKLDTVVGLNDQGQTRSSVFPPSSPTWDSVSAAYTTWAIFASAFATWSAVTSSVFRARRLKFLKRSTHLAFRLYQGSCLMTRLRLGPYQVGYKLQRPGRI